MKRSTALFAFILCITTTSTLAQASTVTTGSINFSFGGNSYSAQYNYFPPLYGNVNGVDAYLDNTTLPYSGTLNSNGSIVSGTFDPTTGNSTLGLTINSPSPGSSVSGLVNLFGTLYYTGTLDNFSYTYNFAGSRDSLSDNFSFVIQTSIEFSDGPLTQYVYSDYGTSGLVTDPMANYRTNWVYYNTSGNTTGYSQSINGTNIFDYSEFGEQNWVITFDFSSNASDTIGTTENPVPIPSTLLLLGPGIAGLVGMHRKKKA